MIHKSNTFTKSQKITETYTFLFHALKIEFVSLHEALSMTSPLRIYTAEEPIHDVLENVDLFLKHLYFKHLENLVRRKISLELTH